MDRARGLVDERSEGGWGGEGKVRGGEGRAGGERGDGVGMSEALWGDDDGQAEGCLDGWWEEGSKMR